MPNISRLVAAASLGGLGRALERLGPGTRSNLARSLMQRRYDPRVRILAGFFDNALRAWKNQQYDIGQNGEDALLRRLAPFAPRVLFDIGANVGEWTLAACAAIPGGTVHAFEIAAQTADALERAVAPEAARVVTNRFGLSDHEGEVPLYLSPFHDTANSTLRAAIEVAAAGGGIGDIVAVPGRVTTGDAYMRERGIDRADMLKIDVEGAEPAVLAGFADAFARDAIGIVQFEYGPFNLVTRHMLGDYARFFGERGFVLGKLLPEGVAFKPFEIADEDFVGANIVACHESRGDIIEALRCPPLRPA